MKTLVINPILVVKHNLTLTIGEEKKTLAPLLAKLHISPASTPSLLQDTYNEVSIAIEDKLIADATGRNALFKIHVSLGKIANSLKEKDGGEIELVLRGSTRGAGPGSLSASVSGSGRGSRMGSAAPSVSPSAADTAEGEVEGEGLTKLEEQEESEGTVMGDADVTVTAAGSAGKDELLDELLSDGDVEMSGL